MTKIEVEMWARKIIGQVENSEPKEDDSVELKSNWPIDHRKTARQIAGQANQLRGSPILWIIGVDETSGVVGATDEEVSTWWPQVQKYFQEISPALTSHVNFTYGDAIVVALIFDTQQAPFVVKRDENTLETPWREGTRTRSAYRQDLISLLSSQVFLPFCECLECRVSISDEPSLVQIADKVNGDQGYRDSELMVRLDLSVKLYLTLKNSSTVCFPFHKGKVSLTQNRSTIFDWDPIPSNKVQLVVDKTDSYTLSMSKTIGFRSDIHDLLRMLKEPGWRMTLRLTPSNGGAPMIVSEDEIVFSCSFPDH